jgi:ribosomal protein L25 (general stress protein Ctc)
LYYERMAFVIEIPEISEMINGNQLSLSIGGVRSYNQENLFSKKSIEKFKVFIGFQNTVCTNLCISTDGLKQDIRVSSVLELKAKIYELINSYDKKKHLQQMNEMNNFSISETEFAHLIGKMKLYSFLDKEAKSNLFHLNINDNQINTIVKDYHIDPNFARFENGNIDFWRLYNLFTEANKSSYIDTNFEKNVNAYEFINYLANFIKNDKSNWFLR